MGIRPTARMTGLPVGTVQDIAEKYKVKLPEKPMKLVPIHDDSTSVQPDVRTISLRPAHTVIADEMQRLGTESRLSAARYSHLTLAHAAKQAQDAPEIALAVAGDVKSVVGVAQGANVPGFEREPQGQTAIQVNIGLASSIPPPDDYLPDHIEMDDPLNDPMF